MPSLPALPCPEARGVVLGRARRVRVSFPHSGSPWIRDALGRGPPSGKPPRRSIRDETWRGSTLAASQPARLLWLWFVVIALTLVSFSRRLWSSLSLSPLALAAGGWRHVCYEHRSTRKLVTHQGHGMAWHGHCPLAIGRGETPCSGPCWPTCQPLCRPAAPLSGFSLVSLPCLAPTCYGTRRRARPERLRKWAYARVCASACVVLSLLLLLLQLLLQRSPRSSTDRS